MGAAGPILKEIPMRIVLAALLTTVAISAAAPVANAQRFDPYPWCAEYGTKGDGGGTNCYFATYQQCMAAISGNGGFCRRNLFYTGPYGGEPPRRYPRRAH
jgi:hypothetical protein